MQDENHQSLLKDFFVNGKKALSGNSGQQLFRLITLPNGTTKNTSTGRLDDLNSFAFPFLPASSTLEIKDIAVSSGISTMEWAQQLEEKKIHAAITASDLFVKAFLVMKSPGVAILCDNNMVPLLIEIRRSFFRTSFPWGSLRYYWGKLISKAIKATWINEKNEGNSVYPVELLLPGIKSTKGISFIEEDILLPPPVNEIAKYDVLRAANILNKVYFRSEELKKILLNLAAQLKPGGIFIVCKTDDAGINHASVFTRQEKQFSLLGNLNGGSEIKNLVSEFSF